MVRVYTKIGDIFSIQIDEKVKRYFQLIAYDLTQLNSDVIRAFKKQYPIDFEPNLLEIVHDEVEFYVHCTTKIGVKMNFWKKIGNNKNIGKIDHILFRDTEDYGIKIDGEPIKISYKWYVWHINDRDFTDVGKLNGEYQNSYIGLIINPNGIMELMKGNKYPINYPSF